MLKLYYARPSLYARPVWLALLEKQIPFELIPVNLDGDQLEPDFLALNPFGHIPVLLDGEFRVLESLAILDYLEAKYPTPALLPQDPVLLARVRMIQLVALNELLPAIVGHLINDVESNDFRYAQVRAANTLRFLESSMVDWPFIAGEQLTLAEIVAGTLIPTLPDLGVALSPYPKVEAWCERLMARSSWQKIKLTPEEWVSFKRQMRVLPRIWQRRRRQKIAALASTAC